MKHPLNALMCVMCALVLSFAGTVAAQQNFPTKPIKIVVPSTSGGPADLFARAVGQGITAIMKQPVLLDFVPGAGGITGVAQAAKAAPDGYTWALNSANVLAISPFVKDDLSYDPLKDLALISLVASMPEVVTVNASLPVSNLAELIAYFKANPGKVSFGSAGPGTLTHLSGELLKFETKADMVHVPYSGGARAVTDLLGNQVQLVVLDAPVVLPNIKAGKLKAIAVLSPQRSPALPDVPSATELGFPRLNAVQWYGLVGNGKVPADIQQRMNAAVVFTLKQSSVSEAFANLSAVPTPSTQQEYRKFVMAEQAKWGPIVKAIGFKE